MKFQIYIQLPVYEIQWCRKHFGDPCTFPAQSNVNNVIRHFLKKRPADVPVERQQDNQLAINIPDSRSKDPQYYNYLTKYGKAAIAEAINDIFTMQMFENLTDVKMRGISLTNLVADWMEENGIDYDQVGNVYQKFTRIKDSYRKQGINISRGYKHENRAEKRKK